MQKDLGGLPPEQALDYMEKTSDLVIVNVAGRGFWDRNHFDGAVNIPTEDIGDDASIEKLKSSPPAAPSSCTAAAATWWSTGTRN